LKRLAEIITILAVINLCAVSAGGDCAHPEEISTASVAATQPLAETAAPASYRQVKFEYTATAYCPCIKCCGEWAKNRPGGIVKGASGKELKAGRSMASPLPFGTKVILSGAGEYDGEYICEDRTADYIVERYSGHIIDIYFENHEAAMRFGKRQVTIEILEREAEQ